MDFKEITSSKKFFRSMRELSFEEAKQIEDNHFIDDRFINLCKLVLKRYLIDFINLFLKKKKEYDINRSIENVKSKYDNISGSYIEFHGDNEDNKFTGYNHYDKKPYLIDGGSLSSPANIISQLYNHYDLKSIIEIGAGELTTLFPVLQKIKKVDFVAGLDLSFKRLQKGKNFLDNNKKKINQLVACDASNLPYKDNSFDLVFTHYCIEQVPLLAKQIISEMIRISSKYVIVIEPSYEFSNKITKARILNKGFPILKKSHFKNTKSKIIYRDGLPFTRYALYGEVTIIEKIDKISGKPKLCHPITKKNIELNNDIRIKVKDGIIDLSSF
jgi:ubiquinone/menaquinone biosynthesis C-methylase UbiE